MRAFLAPLRYPRRRPATARAAMPWDALLGGEDVVEVPTSTDELGERLQDCMLTSVEKAFPRMDIELPPGLRMGIFEEQDSLEPRGELKPADIARADRDLAAAWVTMFAELKNDRSLCVAFRSDKLATLAKRAWRNWGKVKIISLAAEKERQRFGSGSSSLLERVARPFLVAVAPSVEQLKEIKGLDLDEEATGKKICVVLVNARIRGLTEGDPLREELAAGSNPILHARFVGDDGFAYKTLGSPWVLSRRQAVGEGEDKSFTMEEVERFGARDGEPSEQRLRQALGVAR